MNISMYICLGDCLLHGEQTQDDAEGPRLHPEGRIVGMEGLQKAIYGNLVPTHGGLP